MKLFALPNCAFSALGALVLATSALAAQAETITMASTTSTEQSGLFAHLIPAFKQASNIGIKVVAVGTGQAIDLAKRGDADVLFVHDTAAEEKFVAEGYSARRFPVMYNDFVLIGPKAATIKTNADMKNFVIGVAKGAAQDTQVTKNAPEGTTIRRFDGDAPSIQAIFISSRRESPATARS